MKNYIGFIIIMILAMINTVLVFLRNDYFVALLFGLSFLFVGYIAYLFRKYCRNGHWVIPYFVFFGIYMELCAIIIYFISLSDNTIFALMIPSVVTFVYILLRHYKEKARDKQETE